MLASRAKARRLHGLGRAEAVATAQDDVMTKPGTRQSPEVRGVGLDAETRCVHYRSAVDIVAIKVRCCGVYYACKDCHVALAGHAIAVWPRGEWEQRAVLCGACGAELTIWEYLQGESRCPGCGAGFNPGCRAHWHFYFEGEGESEIKPGEGKT